MVKHRPWAADNFPLAGLVSLPTPGHRRKKTTFTDAGRRTDGVFKHLERIVPDVDQRGNSLKFKGPPSKTRPNPGIDLKNILNLMNQ